MNPEQLNPEEQALLDYLLETENRVLVALTEDTHPDSQSFLESVREFQKSQTSLDLIEGRFSTYQRLARTQDAFGFPCLMIFRSGELEHLILGAAISDELNALSL